MRSITIFFILVLMNFTHQQEPMACFLWKNSFVQIFRESPSSLKFLVYSRQRNGWMGVQILKEKGNYENSIGVVSNYPDQIIELKNHTQLSTDKRIFGETVNKDWKLFVDGVFSFSFSLNTSIISPKSFIYLAHNLNSVPSKINNQTVIPKHDNMGTENIFFINQTNPNPECNEDLNIPGRIFASHWSIYLVTCLMYLFLSFIYLYFSNDQPLKSRFVAPFVAVFAMYWNLLGEFLIEITDYEKSTHFICLINGFIIYTMIQIV
jgi:hypothetical protein